MRDAPNLLMSATRTGIVCAVALAALSACGGSQSPPANADAPRPEDETTAIDDPTHVLGAWDVVSFEGYRSQAKLIGATRAAYADFHAGGVRLRMDK